MADEKQNPPMRWRFSRAVKYLKDTHSLTITRQTLHNWTKTGVAGAKLKAERLGHGFYTTKDDLDGFVRQLR